MFFTVPGVIIVAATGTHDSRGRSLSDHADGLDRLANDTVCHLRDSVHGKSRTTAEEMHMLVSSSESYDREKFHALYLSWNIWGAIALLLPIAAAVMMVLKIPQ